MFTSPVHATYSKINFTLSSLKDLHLRTPLLSFAFPTDKITIHDHGPRSTTTHYHAPPPHTVPPPPPPPPNSRPPHRPLPRQNLQHTLDAHANDPLPTRAARTQLLRLRHPTLDPIQLHRLQPWPAPRDSVLRRYRRGWGAERGGRICGLCG